MTSTITSQAIADLALPRIAAAVIPPTRNRSGLLARAMSRHVSEIASQAEIRYETLLTRVDEVLQKVLHAPSSRSVGQDKSQTPSGNSNAGEFLKHFIALSGHIEQATPEWHPDFANYARQLILTTVLPIYLRSSSQPLARSIANATQLAWEHRMLLTLNDMLDGDLILAIAEIELVDRSPIHAAQEVLALNLSEIISQNEFDGHRFSSEREHNSIHSKMLENARRESDFLKIAPDQREGYWMIASQWIQQKEAITLPANLAVGAVSWPRLRGHWKELCECLASSNSVVSDNNNEPSQLNTISGVQVGTLDDLLPEVIEIRSSNDPELSRNLEIHLQRCRERSGSLALVVIRCKADPVSKLNRHVSGSRGSLSQWQLDLITTLQASLDHRKMYGFYTTDGDLALIMEDVDRSEVTLLVRKVIETEAIVEDEDTRLLDQAGLPLYSGIACVQSPSKSFRLDQLIESAWRCLEASLRQPPGAVKSIEAY